MTKMKNTAKQGKKRKISAAYGFLFPFLVLFIVLVLIPVIVSFAFSFMRIGGTMEFVGLQNYIDTFRDPLFLKSYTNVLIFMVCNIPLTILVALVLASLLNSAHLHGRGFFKTAYYLPTVTSTVAVASVFLTFYNPTGLFNNLLMELGMNAVPWLTDPFWIRVSMTITVVWMNAGYYTVLFLAGLQSIPADIYESASIDGASRIRQFFSITIPQLKPIIMMSVVLATISGIGTFELPNIFFGSSNGPENSAITVGVNLYRTSFEQVNFGKASAIAWTMVFVAAVLSAIQFKVGGEDDA